MSHTVGVETESPVDGLGTAAAVVDVAVLVADLDMAGEVAWDGPPD